jgi:CHAD domain-containing protein
MILLEEHFISRTEVAHRLGRSLEAILDLRWSSYRKALKRCRKKFSERSVHALRVEIRRMLSMLALCQPAFADGTIPLLQRELKDRLKALSELRDTHVQIDAIAKMLDDSPELEPFHEWLQQKERRLVKQLEGELAQARTGKSTRMLSRLGRALHGFAETPDEDRNLNVLLVHATGCAFEKVLVCYQDVGPENVPAIHRMRTAFKKFRYMIEALGSVVDGITDRQLRAMQAYQTRMGEIQDVDVLLARAEKFVKKAELEDGFFQIFREKQLRRRARLVNRFLLSADRLLNFWPPHAHRASSGRANGLSYSPSRHQP